MAHISLFPGNCEIVEIEEELIPGENYRGNNYVKPEFRREEKDGRSMASNAGNLSSLEDDLNQLFEMFNRRTSSHGSARPSPTGTSKKNSSKKPVKASGSYSPGHGISERVNLKQALRGLCLSQASEMAAMKRTSKSNGSSEAGRIMTMYRNVAVEDSISDLSQDDGRGSMLEISLVPEEKGFDTFVNSPGKLPELDLWPSNRSSLAGRGGGSTPLSNERGAVSKDSFNQVTKHEKPAMSPSFPHVNDTNTDTSHSILTQKGIVTPSNKLKNKAPVTDILQQKHMLVAASSSPTSQHRLREVVSSSMIENGDSSRSARFADQMSLTELSQKDKHASPASSSCSSYGMSSPELAGKILAHKENFAVAVSGGNQISKFDMGLKEENAYSGKAQGNCKRIMVENEESFALAELVKQTPLMKSLQNEKHAPLQSCFPSDGSTSLEFERKLAKENEMTSALTVAGNPKVNVMQEDDRAPSSSPRHLKHDDVALGDRNIRPVTDKLVSKEGAANVTVEAKESGLKGGKKINSKTASSTGSPKGKKTSKSTRNAQHLVKPLIKTRNFVKRKSKKKLSSDNSSKNVHSEFNNDLYSGPDPIVCPRCQCVVTDTWKEANQESLVSHQESPVSQRESPQSRQESPISHHESPVTFRDSPISPFTSLSAEVGSANVISDVSTLGPSSYSSNKSKTVVAESSSNSKSIFKSDFTHSSKGSPGECSGSTSISEESNVSRPSFCDRPHMSKDVRWEAIRHVRYQCGNLGLRHFNLLKKLGCGDIGTVYLAELIGTNCLFAIKVMDNEFLARRKKMSRAQTEKEILRMLDHPFLPTLYCQFTSDNLSCLVMEYCPGGDLHVLRQRQPGRCFTEHAARFYVAEVLLALEYLHMLGVVYRDLKPENILVREDGHIMLSDFDLSLRCAVSPTLMVSSSMSETSRKVSRPCVDSRCVQPLCIEPSFQVTCFTPRLLASSSKSTKLKKVKSDIAAEMRPLLQLVAEPTTARSNSFVGTHEYLAPEIIKGEGHGSAVDWWTFGIFLYELLYGRTPFKGTGNEETLANVVLQSLKFPDSPLVSLQARDLISALLAKEPESRLGTERGAAEIKQHQFFEGLNWALIRCAVPPELPDFGSFGMPKAASLEKNNNYVGYSSGSGSGSAEHLEFEVF